MQYRERFLRLGLGEENARRVLVEKFSANMDARLLHEAFGSLSFQGAEAAARWADAIPAIENVLKLGDTAGLHAASLIAGKQLQAWPDLRYELLNMDAKDVLDSWAMVSGLASTAEVQNFALWYEREVLGK